MQAIEQEATIDARHALRVDLPDTVPPGKAKVIILFEPQPADVQKRAFGHFRGKLTVPEDFNEPLPESLWGGFCRMGEAVAHPSS